MQWALLTACFLKKAGFFPYAAAFLFLAYVVRFLLLPGIVAHLARWNLQFEKEGL